MQLRPYQSEAITQLYKKFADGYRTALLEMPCGAGKTLTAAWMCKSAISKGNNVLFLVHRRELMQQTEKAFESIGLSVGNQIKVDMVLSVGNHLDKYKPDLIIADECNFAMAKSWRKVFDAHLDAWVVGLSATPVRLDGKPLGDVFESMVSVISAKELIEKGALSPYDYYAPTLEIDMSQIRKRAGDYKPEDIEQQINKPAIYGDVIKEYRNLAHDRRTIVYCATVQHSKDTAQAFCEAGYSAKHFDGKTPKKEREKIVDEFRRGEISILCNCDLVSFGFDVPDCDCVVMLRPTASIPIFIQQSMRCMRGKEGKRAIVLDFVGNYQRHGMPTQDREWSLDGKLKPHQEYDKDGKLLTRVCKSCYGTFQGYLIKCPYCGQLYDYEMREIKKIKEAHLVKVEEEKQLKKDRLTAVILEQRQSLAECKNKDEIYAFCRARGWKTSAGYLEMKRRRWIR